MDIKIYYTTLLAVCGIFTETWTTFLPEYQQHKKIIIRVPVITHTVYKIVNKGHTHAGKVIHHHHHDGHVSHVHKHDGEAHHKHQHHGVGDHHHKHVGSADHKHLHAGKAEHGHSHKGHFGASHHHAGHHAHDHKHAGIFSNAHAHSGTSSHSHGHHGEGVHGHGQGHFNSLGFAFGASLLDPNRLSLLADEYNAAMVGSAPPHPPSRLNDNLYSSPMTELAPPPYGGSLLYLPENEVHYRSGAYRRYPTYSSEYSNEQQSYGKTKALGLTYAATPSYSSGELADDPKSHKGVNYKFKSPMFNLFTPEETADIENSLNNIDDFSSVEGGKENPASEFNSHEVAAEPNAYDDEELERGASFQPMKIQVSSPKRRPKQMFNSPIMQYEVTENSPLL